MKVLIIGPQASGKGTQADFLAKKLNVPHLSSGDMLRAEKQSDSALGKEITHMIDGGILVPDELIWKMIKKQLDAHPEGWILDGFPRTAGQAGMLDAENMPEKVLVLEASDDVCIERISGRRICDTCGKDYHVKYKPPKQEGICDIDGGKLIQRPDDNEASVKKRLQDYHELTAPLIEHYGEKVVTINGNQGIEEVWHDIQEKLEL